MENVIILDTETTNDIECPICYDVGFIVMNTEGEIYERFSYVVADVFLDEELMASAYFKDKIPSYWEEIKKGKRELKRFSAIKKILPKLASVTMLKKLLPIIAVLIIFHFRLRKDF